MKLFLFMIGLCNWKIHMLNKQKLFTKQGLKYQNTKQPNNSSLEITTLNSTKNKIKNCTSNKDYFREELHHPPKVKMKTNSLVIIHIL